MLDFPGSVCIVFFAFVFFQNILHSIIISCLCQKKQGKYSFCKDLCVMTMLDRGAFSKKF